ncbi:MAG: sigma 54-interacting transcriptional regulator [Gammaproteobacteria bacterium]|nr:sigma 54-interacting transcriptional regulator [Gammaproteobacteria bacterium]
MSDGSVIDDLERVLLHIAEGTASATGAEFLTALLPALATCLGVKYAFISEFIDDNMRARILAFWNGSAFGPVGEYLLAGTPCELVLNGEVICFPRDVAAQFPAEAEQFAELGVESYFAIPMLNAARRVMGHLAIMDTKPLSAGPRDLAVFRIFGARAGAELERMQADAALRASEERLSRLVGSAMDAIVTIDGGRRITLFNPAAERIFGCAAAWAIGQPLDRFLSAPLRELVVSHLARADAAVPLWLPSGHSALRANGAAFPIEATVSLLEAGGETFHTLILRDIDERRRAAEEIARLQQEAAFLKREVLASHAFEEMIGATPVMRELFETLGAVAAADSTVLVIGETGTGKEQIAHALHKLSGRREAMLVKLNCAALPSELIESELFGHEKGAFTGATVQRKGRFELADGGTLFLDEVGELSMAAQAKLLRALQEQEFERVGGTRTIKVDVRVIAATNRDLGAMVQAGTFRSDLYYRLNVFPIEVPPLRARVPDIAPLAAHFLARLARKLGKPLTGFNAASLARLERYGWPGNIRELQNVVERAAVLAKDSVVSLGAGFDAGGEMPGGATAAARTLEEVEAAHIRSVLEDVAWIIEGKRGAATILGLEPSTLRYRMGKLGIRRPSR